MKHQRAIVLATLSLCICWQAQGASSLNFAMPTGSIASAVGTMASASYSQTGVLHGPEALGISSSANYNNLAGALAFLDGVPAVAPVAPVVSSIIAGNHQLKVYFQAPAFNGGADVSGYTVTCTDGVTNYTAQGLTSPLTVTHLTNGVSYTCSVTAANSAGTSVASAVLTKIARPQSIAPIISILLD